MNRISQKVHKMMSYYFDDNKDLINDYLTYGIKDALMKDTLKLETKQQLIPQFERFPKKLEDRLFGKHPNAFQRKVRTQIYKQNDRTMKNVLSKMSYDDFAFLDMDHSKCWQLRSNDMDLITDSLPTYLFINTTKKFQINWMLRYKPMSDAAFAKIIGAHSSQITDYRIGNLKLGKMPLDAALDIIHYYIIFINRRTSDDDVNNHLGVPDKSSIIDSKNDVPQDLVSFISYY